MSPRPKDVGPALVFTCEHAGNQVPEEFAWLFAGREELLQSHRGWDPGALVYARILARRFGAPLLFTEVTRLLVEANRSEGHPRLFSDISRALSAADKEAALDAYRRPHWRAVERAVREGLTSGREVLHIGCHTFTPVLDGVERGMDVGLLYDPRRTRERELCAAWKARLADVAPGLLVRRNAPYRGDADGLSTSLRRMFPESVLGVEIEVNQRFARELGAAPEALERVADALGESLAAALA